MNTTNTLPKWEPSKYVTAWGCQDCAEAERVIWSGYIVTPDYDALTGDGVATFSKSICGLCASRLAGSRFRFAVWYSGTEAGN